eukprot:4492920-Amphidinium_carterae.1
MRRRRRRATVATGTHVPDVPPVPVRRTREDWTDDADVAADTANIAQRQRVTTGGDYYTTHQEYDRPDWHQRHDDQGCSTYTRLVWQHNTCDTQAEWQQHPLWRMCG